MQSYADTRDLKTFYNIVAEQITRLCAMVTLIQDIVKFTSKSNAESTFSVRFSP